MLLTNTHINIYIVIYLYYLYLILLFNFNTHSLTSFQLMASSCCHGDPELEEDVLLFLLLFLLHPSLSPSLPPISLCRSSIQGNHTYLLLLYTQSPAFSFVITHTHIHAHTLTLYYLAYMFSGAIRNATVPLFLSCSWSERKSDC